MESLEGAFPDPNYKNGISYCIITANLASHSMYEAKEVNALGSQQINQVLKRHR